MTEIVLLDGGMGQELIHRSSLEATPLWSATVMMDEPEIVEAVHRDYVNAGAKVLIINTYSVTPERLEKHGDPDMFEPLQRKAIEIAQNAIGDTDVVLAGSLPPLRSSYQPHLAPDFEPMLGTYRQIAVCQAAAVDVILCETMSSVKEVQASTRAAFESGKPVWTAMSVEEGDGTKLRSGERLEHGVAAAKEEGATAVLINCSWPESVSEGLPFLAKSGLPFGAYANGFTSIKAMGPDEVVDVLEARQDLGPEQYADFALGWIEAGATIVGGCCEVGPAHIARLAVRLREAGHEIVGRL